MLVANKELIDDIKIICNDFKNDFRNKHKAGVCNFKVHYQLDEIKPYLLDDLILIVREYYIDQFNFKYKINYVHEHTFKECVVKLYLLDDKNTKNYNIKYISVRLTRYNSVCTIAITTVINHLEIEKKCKMLDKLSKICNKYQFTSSYFGTGSFFGSCYAAVNNYIIWRNINYVRKVSTNQTNIFRWQIYLCNLIIDNIS